MEQLEFFTVPSPCVGVCSTDEKGYCKGCMRRREERFQWLSFTPAQQLHIIKLCKQRYLRKTARKATKVKSNSVTETPQQNLFEENE